MQLVVFSHKPCWASTLSTTGYATDGGFAFQMQALSELFDATRLIVPCSPVGERPGEIPITGHNLTVTPIANPGGTGIWRKLALPWWLARHSMQLLRETRKADVIHAPIPGDIGTIGMLLAPMFGKPLFVRHCGNWFVQRTMAERFWKWFMEKFASGENLMLVTGGAVGPPSLHNPNLQWIFSTSLREQELKATGLPRKAFSGEGLRLIIACRQEREKGTGIVIESLALLLKEFPGVALDVLGDGTAIDEFKHLAQERKLDRRITFHGKVNHQEVIGLLQQADLFCYPTSASEGFPKVVLEALACGLPVITTQVSVLPQLLANGCGILLQDTTPESVAQAVRKCLSDKEGYRLMSAKAIETARQYSLERWRDTIGSSLHKLCGPLKTDG
jgi:glycosyltransferase involved in cell wall biosynthesis